MQEVWLLRLSHRASRDKRISTHCALVARALGARGIIYSGQRDEGMEESVRGVVRNWGGDFEIIYEKSWKSLLKRWKGKTAHLTVYGIPFEEEMEKIRKARGKLLLIFGGEKVPSEVYHMVDYNVSVTTQPHSEVAAITLFLDRFFKGRELGIDFQGKLRVVPQKRGKQVIKS